MKKNALEWSVFAVSLGLIAVCVGVLGYEQLTRTNTPPNVMATPGDVQPRPGGFAVEVIVRNTGDRTAAGVHLSATIRGTDDTAEAVAEYVPYRSTRRLWVTFRSDPRDRAVDVRVLGYQER
jgi:uncharacterized protein (TIGR02588 family)